MVVVLTHGQLFVSESWSLWNFLLFTVYQTIIHIIIVACSVYVFWYVYCSHCLQVIIYVRQNVISIRGIMDYLHENNPVLQLEQSCVPNNTVCSTNSTMELLYDGVRGAKLKKRERSSTKHPQGLSRLLRQFWFVIFRVYENFNLFSRNWVRSLLRPCLVPKKFCKIFQIPRHIESLDTCMKY